MPTDEINDRASLNQAETTPRAANTVWRNRDFRLLFGAQIISLLGSGVTTVGLALFAYQLTGGASATAVIGNALTLRILAFLLFSQPAGVIADRVSRKRILIAADLIRFALLALFPFITAVWQIYTLIFAINAVTAFFTPTFESTVPEVVAGEQYVRALSLSRVATDVEAVAAPALAGLLVALLGLRWVFWFDAFTYLVSASLVALAAIPYVRRSLPRISVPSFLRELTTGTRILLREPSLRQALTLSIAEATAGAAAIVVTVSYVRDVLGRGQTTFAFVMAGVGFGSSLTAIFLGRATGRYEKGIRDRSILHGRRHKWGSRALLAGGFLLGLLLLPDILKPPLLVFSLLWILNGAGQALIAIPSSTLLAEHTIEGERGRAYAAHFALTHLCWLASYPGIGHASAKWGSPLTFTGAGVICLLVTVIAMLLGYGKREAHTHQPSPR